MFTLIPDSFITKTHNLERIVVEIGLFCFTKLTSNLFVPVFRKDAVILISYLR